VSKTTTIATGRITAADIITITYVEPFDSPAVAFVRWPANHRSRTLTGCQRSPTRSWGC
jgi:hypothetical protein